MRYLLVINAAGNLMLADIEKDLRMPIGAPLTPDQKSHVTMATWSPQGQWTAWSVDSEDAAGIRQVRLHDETSDYSSVLVDEIRAFCLSPSPCGRWLSHLSPSPLGLELAVSNIVTGHIHVVERGEPLFWSWSPDGTELAVHVDTRTLVTDVDGTTSRLLTTDAGPFVAPWWLPGGSVVYAVHDQIVAMGPDGVITTLVAQDASGRFSLGPEGRRLAYVATGRRPALAILDLVSLTTTEATSAPIVAFFWSPDGSRLAALTAMGDGWVQWKIIDGADTVHLSPFRPSRNWATSILPFFEQFAQSHTPWSGDGTALVAPAVDDGGRSGAVIQTIAESEDPKWIPDAELVWWA